MVQGGEGIARYRVGRQKNACPPYKTLGFIDQTATNTDAQVGWANGRIVCPRGFKVSPLRCLSALPQQEFLSILQAVGWGEARTPTPRREFNYPGST